MTQIGSSYHKVKKKELVIKKMPTMVYFLWDIKTFWLNFLRSLLPK
jgi:hypothetical protein